MNVNVTAERRIEGTAPASKVECPEYKKSRKRHGKAIPSFAFSR